LRILNSDALCSHGNQEGRKKVIEILEAGLQAANPYHNTCKLIRLEGSKLIVGNPLFEPGGSPRTGDEIFDLDTVGNIYVIGAAKGIQHVALAFEDILGDRLTGGHVIAKHGDEPLLKRIGVTYGAHPVPDEGCVRGCENILKICDQLQPNDLVFTIVGNGVSALLTLPVDGVSLEDIRQITYEMQIEKGVRTEDLNPVRNHLDQMKGGQISRRLKNVRAIHLLAFDSNDFIYPSDIPQTARYGHHHLMHRNLWLHTLPDFTTFADAVAMLKKYDVWDHTSEDVRQHLLRADPCHETVKAEEFESMDQRIFGIMPKELGPLPMAEKKAIELGFKPYVLSRFLQAEASQAGYTLMDIAKTIESEGIPFKTPCVLLSAGELLVTVGEEKGMGGRNQEFALASALRIRGSQSIVVGAIDTDGTDGPGDQFNPANSLPCLGGGLIDGQTAIEAAACGIDLHTALRQHNTSRALWDLNSGIHISQNISLGDLDVILIMNGSTS
jgi:glycerate 2-kinase